MGDVEYTHPVHGRIITCETAAAYVVHVRRLGRGFPAVKLSGHWPRPGALCGAEVAWDTQIPATEKSVSCRSCRKACGWPEFMGKPASGEG